MSDQFQLDWSNFFYVISAILCILSLAVNFLSGQSKQKRKIAFIFGSFCLCGLISSAISFTLFKDKIVAGLVGYGIAMFLSISLFRRFTLSQKKQWRTGPARFLKFKMTQKP
jgi:hypothetical protein